MKKYVVYLLLFAMCLSLFACGDESYTVVTDAPTETGVEIGSSESDESEASSKEPETNGGESQLAETQPAESKPSETNQGGDETSGSKEDTESEAVAETETEDPRLSMDYAPSVYFDPKDLYEITKDGVYGENANQFAGYDEVTVDKDEDGTAYVRLLAYNDYNTLQESIISVIGGTTTVSPYLAIKYRTKVENIYAQIYADSVNVSAGSGSGLQAFNYISDGEWHIYVINLKRIANFNGKTLNYCRYDFMNAHQGTLPTDAYVDFAYIGFFNTENDVQMFETGEIEEVVYIDPSSGYSESKVTHNTFIDMINGQNESGVGTYDSRGGNSLAGIDTFLFNNTTFDGGILVFSGWTLVDGGVEKYMWSADNGKTWFECGLHGIGSLGNIGIAHINATEKATGATVKDRENSLIGGGYQGSANMSSPKDRAKGLSCDLSAYVGQTVNVVFAAMPKNDPNKLSLIAYVKAVEVVAEYEEETEAPPEVIAPEIEPKDCDEHNTSVEWHPVAGQLKEQKLCTKCGYVIDERDTAYRLSIDLIEDKNGMIFDGSGNGLKWYGVNKVIGEVDATAMQLRSGYDFVVQGWLGCNSGMEALVYRVNGGEWIACPQKPEQAKSAVVEAIANANLGLVRYSDAAGFRVSVPLKDFAGNSVTVEFGAQPRNNTGVVINVITLTNITVPELPEEPETTEPSDTPETPSEIAFTKAIDKLVIGETTVSNPGGGYGGKLFTYDASAITLTSSKIQWSGWACVNDGFASWVYSVDGGETWTPVGGSYGNITRADIVSAVESGGYTNALGNGSIEIIADLSAYIGRKVDIIFGAVPNSNAETVLQMVKITNVTFGGECSHASVGEWMPVEGQLKESATCATCGNDVTRDLTFVICSDKIEHSTATIGWQGSLAKTTPCVVDTEGITASAQGLHLQGWAALNGGISAYKWSVDGVTWYDVDASSGYGTGSDAHYNIISGLNTGVTNYTHNLQYNVTIGKLLEQGAGTYTVYLGAIPANNTSVVVPIIQINNVIVP